MSSYRRRPRRRPSRHRQGSDPVSGVVLVQVVLCCLLVSLVYFGRQSPNPLYQQASVRLDELMEQPIAQVFAAQRQENQNLAFDFDYADKFFSGFEKTGDEGTALPQGGLFPVAQRPDRDGKLKAPENAILSPVRISHPLYAPVEGVVTSFFGYRIHPTTHMLDFHTGLDIAAPMGSSISAALPGVVEEVGQSPIYGNFITLRHSKSLATRYCHCEKILVEEGANLREGEHIALVGTTGVSTGPHLHFEVYVDGYLVDPSWVLRGLEPL